MLHDSTLLFWIMPWRLRKYWTKVYKGNYFKQILQVFLFNGNYSPKVINIQWREAELNIILPRVNNFDIIWKQDMEYLCYYMAPKRNKIWEDKINKTQQSSIKTQVFFVKTELRHIDEIDAWSSKKTMILIYDISITDITGVQ